MKPFNLERALAGDPVIDEHGREYSQFHFFELRPSIRSLACVCNGEFNFFDKNGCLNKGIPYLYMKPKTKKLWIAIAKDSDSDGDYDTSYANSSKESIENVIGYPEEMYQYIEVEIEE